MVVEDLCLDNFPCQGRRKTIFVGINGDKSGFVHREAGIPEYRERIFRKLQQRSGFFLPQLLDGDFTLVVLALGVFFAPIPEALVEILKRSYRRHRDERIAAAVTHLVLYVSFFVA